MRSIPQDERPYEKCMRFGTGALSDAELLAVILRTGAHGMSALTLARRVLEMGGTEGLLGIYHADLAQLKEIRGVGTVKAIQLKCIGELARRFSKAKAGTQINFQDPDSVARYYMEEMRHQEQEIVMSAMLNSKNMLIRDEVIARGAVNFALISPREILIAALRCRAVGFILLHNHPSGNPAPSGADIHLTRQLREGALLVGLQLLDHIIIGDKEFYSMKKEGILDDLDSSDLLYAQEESEPSIFFD